MDDMQKIEEDLAMVLNRTATLLREAATPGDIALQFEKLASQVAQPCIVAVVGQVKAGKSSFINALLGQDLAKVGTTETTATINYFRYSGGKIDTDHPVRCFWRNGNYQDVDLAFLDSLQGNDVETLRRADGIDHLEYYLPSLDLEHVTLVDTPGTGAVVDEHQNITAEFIHLHRQLRQRHDQETQELRDTADAVIYLIGAVALAADQKFLDEFTQLTQGESRAFNAVGVMSKIDLYPETVQQREELAAKIATQLKDNLNTVVPVSAGLSRALDILLTNDRARLKQLMQALRDLLPGKLDKFLSSPALYLKEDPAWPVESRKELRGTMEWMVFVTIARVAANPALDANAIERQLKAIGGFDQLKQILEHHIFKRSRILRCYRIVSDACHSLNKLEPKMREHERSSKAKLERFLNLIQRVPEDQLTAITLKELREFVREHLTQPEQLVTKSINEVRRELDRLFHELEVYNADFEALHIVTEHPGLFSILQSELLALFGLYGLETEKRLPPDKQSLDYLKERQRTWRQVSMMDRNPLRRQVAEQAVSRYGFLLDELLQRHS